MSIKDTGVYRQVRSRYHQTRAFLRDRYNSFFFPYYRDVFSKKILSTRPCHADKDNALELHHLTCKRDVINSLWSLKTFLHYSKSRPRVVIHNDGSMDQSDKDILEKHLADVVIIDRDEADEVVRENLRPYPFCSKWRFGDFKSVYSIKLFDFFFSQKANRS